MELCVSARSSEFRARWPKPRPERERRWRRGSMCLSYDCVRCGVGRLSRSWLSDSIDRIPRARFVVQSKASPRNAVEQTVVIAGPVLRHFLVNCHTFDVFETFETVVSYC